jgi:hypothetical protein
MSCVGIKSMNAVLLMQDISLVQKKSVQTQKVQFMSSVKESATITAKSYLF